MNDIFYVDIYCKVYADSFSTEMTDTYTTGDELYKWLISRSNNTFDEDDFDEDEDKEGEPLNDHNIWLLGCNQKFGHMSYRYRRGYNYKWGFRKEHLPKPKVVTIRDYE